MKYQSTLIAVKDIDKSVEFYRKVLGLGVIADFGRNKTLTGGIALQTDETWKSFIQTNDVKYGANDGELYFEEDDFDTFAATLSHYEINYVHPVTEHRWGQRVVRFYDPDMHIIEVGENLKAVVKRFARQGMNNEQIAVRMDIPLEMAERLNK